MNCQDSPLSECRTRGRSPAAGSSSNAASAWARSRWASCCRQRATPRRRPTLPADPLAPKAPHYAAKAKRVIFLFMAGGAQPPGAVRLQAAAGQVRRHAAARPSCSRATAPRSSIPTRSCWARSSSSPGTASAATELSELLPHLAEVVDDIAIVKSMVTDAFNHAPARS